MNLMIKNNKLVQFLLILFVNILFFSLSAYILPIRYSLNDDVAMCFFASGTYTGTPEARLIFINVIYGFVLTLFYNLFPAIEWYAVFFGIIHIISLSIIVYIIIASNKARLTKIVTVSLFYALELQNIQSFQFTTTAAIAAFAGIILLFEKKRVFPILGTILFIIGALIRFQAAMLIMLLMLPFFIYEIFPKWRKNFKKIIYASICICMAYIFQIADGLAYKSNDWSYYKEYNLVRGQINDNPNRGKINLNELPEGISIMDYYLLLMFFPDGKQIDLSKMKEIRNLFDDVKLIEKLRNIWPSLYDRYRDILLLIIALFILCFIMKNQKKARIFIISYLLLFIIVLSMISMNSLIKPHVFLSSLFPILFFVYYIISIPSVDNVNKAQKANLINNSIFAIIALFLFIFFLNTVYRGVMWYRYYEKTDLSEQKDILRRINNRDFKLIAFAADLNTEFLCSPFEIKKFYKRMTIYGAGWCTNIPYNRGRFDSFLSLLEEDVYFFISVQNGGYVSLIQNSLMEHYNIENEVVLAYETDNYLLLKFVRKEESDTI